MHTVILSLGTSFKTILVFTVFACYTIGDYVVFKKLNVVIVLYVQEKVNIRMEKDNLKIFTQN